MKRKVTCFTSMALAVLMAVSPVVGSSASVFAAEPSDNTEAIQVEPSKEETSDEIVVEADSDAIEVKKEMQASVKVGDTGKSDITVEKEYPAGDFIPVRVTAENPTDTEADFRLYFWDYTETLPEDKAEWSEVLTDACEDVKIAELQDTDEYAVELKQGEDTVQSKVSFVFDKDDKDQLTAAYLSLEIPAEASLDTVFHISSDTAETVTIVPVFDAESEKPFYEDAAAAQWIENPIVVEADETEETAETEPETEDADAIVVETEEPADSFLSIYVGDGEAETAETDTESEVSVEAESEEDEAVTVMPDTADLNASDFASMRLVVLADDASVIANDSDVIGQYGNVYLLQFTSIQQAMNAYTYYRDKVTAVEPDAVVEAAAETESVQKADISMTADGNPVAMLNEVEASEEVQDAHGVIALIDTGVSESENVIDRVSVIDDVLEGNGHGDEMVKAIVSQDAEAQILSIRAMDDNGFGTVSSLVAAMEYAIEQKVDVINLSLYAKATLSTSVLEQEILKATEAGIVVVGSAGNDGQDAAGYMPGAVEEAYIIGAANADGSRLETSNFGVTVDYNVVAGSTSEAAALFTGYVSANGIDAVEGAVNQGMIYATDYITEEPDDKPEIEIPEGEQVDFSDGIPLTVDYTGADLIITVTDKETGDYHVYDVTKEISEIMVPDKDIVHMDVRTADEHYNFVSAELLNSDGDVVSTAYPVEIRRNAFFDVDVKEVAGLSVKSEEQDYLIPIHDEWADKEYWESLLCSDTCLEEHVRKNKPCFDLSEPIETDGPIFTTDEDTFVTAGFTPSATPSVGSTYSGRCTFHFYGSHGHSGEHGLTFTSGALSGLTRGLVCTRPGAANPGDPYYGEMCKYGTYTATVTAYNAATGAVTLKIHAAPDNYINNNFQTVGGTAYMTYIPPIKYTNISVKKVWSDYNNESGARPSSIEVGLYWSTTTPVNTSGTPYKRATLNASNNWSYTWKNEEHSNAGTTYYYAVKELSVPTYYTVSYSQPACKEGNVSATVTNKIQEAYLKLHKDSTLPNISDNNNCYSLEGAEYTVYTTRSGNSLSGKVGVLKTDKNGDSNTLRLLPKTYYIKETKAPKGFEPNPQIYTVTLTTGNTSSKPYVLNVEDIPGNDPMGIQIDKIWNGEETPTIPSLAGTQFTVKYFDNMDGNTSGTPKKTWVLEVQKQSNGTWRAFLQDKYLVKDKSDDFYRDTDTNLPLLPYGTYWIKETQHAPGYTFEGTWGNKDGSVSMSTTQPYVTVVDKNTDGNINLVGGNEYTGHNKPHDTSIKIHKLDENNRPLAGVTFTLTNSKGEVVSTKTSGSDGYVVWDKLYPDIYTVTEVEAPNGKTLLADDIEIHLPMRVTEEDIKKYNIDRSKLSEWDKEEQCYYLFDVTYEVSNDVTFKMPMSGGLTTPMTFVPLIAGMGILGGLGVVGFRRKRKK